ncbi:MAG: PQQ-binding-like beta-propeller repeat protein, partial [Halobacteriales archaeon]|nr:PQQ-binding-like beta-propeller repeat protein [Halobacteriales archaeon]
MYVQDMENNVFALDRSTGEVRWSTMYGVPTEGPNGIAVAYGRVFGGLGDSGDAFALDAETGEEFWRVNLTNNAGEGIDMAPTVYDNVVYISTVPGSEEEFYEGGQRGILYALDAETGETLWSFDTTAGEPTGNLWGNPRINSGGGLWSPLSVDDDGNIYFGVGNPAPWPGTEAWPNATSRPGPNNYTNSMVSLDPETGAIRWFHNARPHDLFDLDHHLTPILVEATYGDTTTRLAIGGGKTGTVTAADRDTGHLVWETQVGIHQNDTVTHIPEGRTLRVYPGALGGVETPMAYANGTVFVPVVNLWSEYSSTSFQGLQNLADGTGELVALDAATGEVQWSVDLPVINV